MSRGYLSKHYIFSREEYLHILTICHRHARMCSYGDLLLIQSNRGLYFDHIILLLIFHAVFLCDAKMFHGYEQRLEMKLCHQRCVNDFGALINAA